MKNKGITLIILIITIIIMLILAGVAITALLGDGGIISKAKNAAEQYNQTAQNEENMINDLLGEVISTNIKEGEVYYTGVEITYSSSKDVVSATLNGSAISNHTTIKESGKYELIIKGAEKEVTIHFFVNSGLIGYLSGVSLKDGEQQVTIKDTIYDIEVINFNEDIEYTENPVLGNNTQDKSLLVLKYNGNLKINEGITITPTVRKKGLVLIVKGNLENNGTISMTKRGAKADGQNVYLWENSDKSFEYVPAVGANGGVGRSIEATQSSSGFSLKGNTGDHGNERQSGGGGSGAVYAYFNIGTTATAVSQSGAKGTSYSGGSGSGGVRNNNVNGIVQGIAASENGGKGGNGVARQARSGNPSPVYAEGGAGNAGGKGDSSTQNSNSIVYEDYDGENGTGGLIIIYTKELKNNALIESKGSAGGVIQKENLNTTTTPAGGGGSGGGSINVFYQDILSEGTITAQGGKGGFGITGGNGGDGCITVFKIE